MRGEEFEGRGGWREGWSSPELKNSAGGNGGRWRRFVGSLGAFGLWFFRGKIEGFVVIYMEVKTWRGRHGIERI